MTPAELLRPLGLEEYLPAFAANGIDAAVLPTLTEADLRELGVVKLGDRKKLSAAIARLRVPEVAPVSPAGDGVSPVAPWIDSWPSPLAIPLREYAGESHPVAKLWAACDLVEMTLRLLVIAQVASTARDGVLPEAMSRQVAEILETPTLGGWFVVAQALAADAGPEATWLRGPLRDLLYGPEKPGTPETSFLRLRNRLAHGGGLTRAEAARLLDLWQPRFERALAGAGFLGEWELLGKSPDGGWRRLRGPDGEPAESPTLAGEAEQDAVWLRRRDSLRLLWPLALYGRPVAEAGAPRRSEDFKAQVYSRREAVRLAYTPVGMEGMAQSESGPSALRAFERLFEARAQSRVSFKVAGCEADLRREAAQMIGRQAELERVLAAVRGQAQGVLWLSGAAGMGKSFLLAKAATALWEEHAGSRTLVLAYRFRSGDQARCSRESLAQFVVERLQAGGSLQPGFVDKPEAKAADRLKHALGGLAADARVILLLDGLDEVQRRDETFAEEVPLDVRLPRVVWCCAGRPEPAIERPMRRLGAEILFADGLPPMTEADIRGMLLERIGALRKKLLAQDREAGGAVMNPFIELVARRAAGLPLYVKYVVGDVLASRYRVLDGDEGLPDSLHAYHEELLRRLGVGDLQAVVTPLAATLACAHEPLTVAQLEAVFLRRGLVQAAGGRDLLERGLAALAAMVTSAPTPEGGAGYVLFHQSLRDHVLTSAQMTQSVGTTRDAWGEIASAEPPPVLREYLLRNAVPHLLDVDRRAAAERLLLDLYHLERMQRAGVTWLPLMRWWMRLGGEERAGQYEQVVAAAMEVSVDEAMVRRGLLVQELASESRWTRLAVAVARVMRDATARALGPTALSALRCAGALATQLRIAGAYDEAIALQRATLAALEATLGEGHADTLRGLYGLGALCFTVDRLPEAEVLLQRAHAGFCRMQGEGDPESLKCDNALGAVREMQGDLAAAELSYRRVLEARRRTLGEGHLHTCASLNNLAGVLYRKGDLAESERFTRLCFQATRELLGPRHVDTLEAENNLAAFAKLRGEYEAALLIQRRVCEAFVAALGADHPKTLEMLADLGETFALKGDAAGAERLAGEVLEARDRVLGPGHRDTVRTVGDLVGLRLGRGDAPAVVEWLAARAAHSPETARAMLPLQVLAACRAGRTAEAARLVADHSRRSPGTWDELMADPRLAAVRPALGELWVEVERLG